MGSTATDPTTRALARQLVDLQREVDLLKRSGRTTQLQSASLMGGGSIPFYDGDGVLRLVLGQQSDGGYAIKTMPPPQPPPRPNSADLVPFAGGIGVTWNGEFITGSTPSDFKQIEVYRLSSPTGILGKTNFIGTLNAPGGIPDAPLDFNSTYYYVFIATNTAEKTELVGTGERATASVPSLAVSAKPTKTVAQDILDGIVTDTKLAADSVGAAQLKVKAIDGTKIQDNSISSPLIIADSILANHIALNQILADHMTADSITAREIRALSIIAEHLQANIINASHITAGAVTASKLEADLVVAERIIAGTATGARVELHPTLGLQAFTIAGTRTIWLDAATGNVNILGSFQSGTGNDRVVIQDAGDGYPSIYFYAIADPVKPAYMNAILQGANRNALGLNSGPNVDSGTSPVQGTLILAHDLVRLFINAAPGNSRGANAIAGSFLGLGTNDLTLRTSTPSTGVGLAEFTATATSIAMRMLRTSGFSYTESNAFQNEINHQVLKADGSSRDGGFIWLRRAGDTIFGHNNGTIDAYIQIVNSTGEMIISSSNSFISVKKNGAIAFYENGTGYANLSSLKSFVIPHPSPDKEESHFLVHGCTESPYAGVEYWGEAFIAPGDSGVTVLLPDYFEDLTALDHRNVQVTQVFDEGDEMMPLFQQLAVSPIKDGKFNIYTSHSGPTLVNWVAKARRKLDFPTEPHRSTVKLNGKGPYTWVEPV